MLQELLAARKLPELKSREEMLKILQQEEYGFLPPKPDSISFDVQENIIPNFCAGAATCDLVTVTLTYQGRTFTFPFQATIPTNVTAPVPFFIHINFRDTNPDRYMPTEEIIDQGFAVLSFCYQDVTKDNRDMTNGICSLFSDLYTRSEFGLAYNESGTENGVKISPPGKIALWAYAASRVMDYAETIPRKLDLNRACVCGHSRLGKTALLSSAMDERFAFAYSNDSGCCGASLFRGSDGETIGDIWQTFPCWFTPSFQKYIGKEEELPFDQHYLVASISPRKVMIGSALEDAWADPRSEFLTCLAASPAFAKGFHGKDRFPIAGEAFMEGDVAYHLRPGKHYFSRHDWQRLMEFVSSHS